MIPDDVFRSRLEATIASLTYWAPTINDAADLRQSSGEGYWKLKVQPHTPEACAFALMLRADQHHDLVVAQESYEDRPTTSLDLFVPLVTAIAEGRVVQRTWSSAATGRQLGVDTIVTLADGRVWRDQRGGTGAGWSSQDGAIGRDRHFAPYRRTGA